MLREELDLHVMSRIHSKARNQDEVVHAACALVPRLKDRAADVELSRTLSDETISDFREAGIYRMCVPTEYGGFGLDVEAAIAICYEVTRGCASSGWIAGQTAYEGILISSFSKEAQAEVWHDNPDVGATSVTALVKAELTPVDGGYLISGRWKFASGVNHASWLIIQQPERGSTDMVLIPRADFEIVDDWFAVGLKGTGSKEVSLNGAFVPHYRVAPLASIKAPAMNIWLFGAIARGIAQSAYDDFERMVSTRRSSKDLSRAADREPVQIALAESSAELECSRLLFESNTRLFQRRKEQGLELSESEGIRVSRDCAYAMLLAYRSTQRLFDNYGSSVIYDSNPIQRALRDIMSASRHGRISWNDNGKKFGMWRLGLLPDVPADA